MLPVFLTIIAFFASTIGSICGIGGGVIIKPVLDMIGILNVKSINFLSGCTVLAMSAYSILLANISKGCLIEWKTTTPLAVGSVVGGYLGRELFQATSTILGEQAGLVQAICLLILTTGTMAYTLKKKHIKTLRITSIFICIVVGLILGVSSAFLGIGGGPINLIVMFYFFSMSAKTAAQNSLYIILFSQLTSLFTTIITDQVPQVCLLYLGLMVLGGIMGGICGRKINKRINAKVVDSLFVAMMVIIIGINSYNVFKFLCP